MTITEFLLARIAEDEREANVCLASPEHTTRRWTRVLAECAAKRALLVLAEQIHDQIEGEWGGGRRISEEGWQDNDGTHVVKTLAAVYADHPDYQPEWAL